MGCRVVKRFRTNANQLDIMRQTSRLLRTASSCQTIFSFSFFFFFFYFHFFQQYLANKLTAANHDRMQLIYWIFLKHQWQLIMVSIALGSTFISHTCEKCTQRWVQVKMKKKSLSTDRMPVSLEQKQFYFTGDHSGLRALRYLSIQWNTNA